MPEVLPTSVKPIQSSKPSLISGFSRLKSSPRGILLLLLLLLFLTAVNLLLLKPARPVSIASMPPIESAEDTQRRVGLISSRFVSPQTAPKLQQEIAEAAAIPNDFPGPEGENVRQGARYAGVFGGLLLAQYYATRDPEILSLAQQVRAFIKKEFPLFYAAGERDGLWEIKGE